MEGELLGAGATDSASTTQESSAWLLAWNPKNWDWADFRAQLEKSRRGELISDRWSCANSNARIGDEVWLVRLGIEPRVICGHGHITRGVFEAPHWDKERQQAGEGNQVVDVVFDSLRDPDSDEAVPISALILSGGDRQLWTPQNSGIQIKPRAADTLQELWQQRAARPTQSSELSPIVAVANEITREHVSGALREIDREGVPQGAESVRYDLIDGATRYPPKLVLEIAAEKATGTRLHRGSFSGGEASTAFRILRRLGFHIERKDAIQQLLSKFLAQSRPRELGVRDYPKSYRGLDIKVSFGKGTVARIPWFAFLAPGQEVGKGIYPLVLYFRDQDVLLVCYGVSEEDTPEGAWPRSGDHTTVRSWFEERFGQEPDRYGDCLVKAGYRVGDESALSGIELQLDSVIAEYQQLTVDLSGEPRPRESGVGYVESRNVVVDIAAAVTSLAEGLLASKLSFGTGHLDFLRAFLASLVTKPFLILTGLSGSGKTQIALRLGEWLGHGYFQVAAVRPDWTGPESIFGYEDGLRPSVAGRAAWAVPAVLEFMLKAAREPAHPHLLLLDEMNLAHVERYFSDFLSGMESRQPCLPNVVRESDGCWRVAPSSPERLPIPKNLWVIGTVNVDETTYMFSPKVLDRASVFEFRVASDDLVQNAARPTACAPCDSALVRGLQAIVDDDDYHSRADMQVQDAVASKLRQLHRLLSKYGLEFGHRTFFEALRFAGIMHLAGARSIESIMDRVVVQRVLPRLHGARRRLELPLLALAHYTQTLPDDLLQDQKLMALDLERLRLETAAKLPISNTKAVRMLVSVRANQFATFAE